MSGETGISETEFDTQIIGDFGVTLTYYVSTKSVDAMGNETETFTTTSNNVIFFKQENKYLFDKDGLLQVADGYIMAPISLGIKRYDKFISPDGEEFTIEKVIRRYVLGVAMQDYGIAFKTQ